MAGFVDGQLVDAPLLKAQVDVEPAVQTIQWRSARTALLQQPVVI